MNDLQNTGKGVLTKSVLFWKVAFLLAFWRMLLDREGEKAASVLTSSSAFRMQAIAN